MEGKVVIDAMPAMFLHFRRWDDAESSFRRALEMDSDAIAAHPEIAL
jgi:hypothetical protein